MTRRPSGENEELPSLESSPDPAPDGSDYGIRIGGPEFVVTLEDGRPWTPKHVFLGWLRLKREAELPDVRFHDCATRTRPTS